MFILKDLVSQKIIKIFLICFITVLIIISLNIFSKIQAARQYLNPLTTQDEFIKTLLLQTLSLYDLGVVDVNNDDQIDLFTANHWHGQNLLISDENHHFSDGLASLKLNHSPDFPGLEASVDLVTRELHFIVSLMAAVDAAPFLAVNNGPGADKNKNMAAAELKYGL